MKALLTWGCDDRTAFDERPRLIDRQPYDPQLEQQAGLDEYGELAPTPT